MAERNDMEDLAQRFVDLWQDQISAMAQDTEMTAAVQRWMSFWMTGNSANRTAASSPIHDDGRAEPPPSRPAATAAASRCGDPDMDEIARRVRELEERLSAMENGVAGASCTHARGSDGARRVDQPE